MKDLRSCLRWFSPLMRKAGWKITVSILIGQARIASSLAFVWICKHLVDIATGAIEAPLSQNIAAMAAILLVQVATGIASSWWENYITLTIRNGERRRVFAHVLSSVWTGRETFHSGDTVNRLEDDIRIVVELVCTKLPDAAVTLCQLIAASIFLLTMAPMLTWILVILMVVAVVGSRLFFLTLRRLTTAIRAKEGEIQGHLQENLQNRLLVLTLIGAGKVLRKMDLLQDDLKANTVKRLNYNAVARGFMSFGFVCGYASAFLWGIYGIRNGSVTYGMMTAFLQLVGQIQRPIAELSHHIPAFIQSLTSVERLMELEQLETEASEEEIPLEGAPSVSVRDITYSYPGTASRKILEHFSFEFKGGSLTVITGPTGAGKSTLTKLILSLLKPQEGEILIGGKPAGPGTRCNFMYVPQGNTIMSGTIRENLLLANSQATQEEMEEALRIASADFVFSLPEGLDTPCSEKGAGFSEGQAQRISIARGILHKGGILILDEATSAIDCATEQRLLRNLNESFRGRKTILFISHREAVSQYADSVLRLDDALSQLVAEE